MNDEASRRRRRFQHAPKDIQPLEILTPDDAPPVPQPRSRADTRLRDALLKMQVEEVRDINRRRSTIASASVKMRKEYDCANRYIIRDLRPGWCRVWRVA